MDVSPNTTKHKKQDNKRVNIILLHLHKILNNTANLQGQKEDEVGEKEELQRDRKNLQGNRHIHYFDYDGGFIGVYLF